jgi:nicotinamide-nucleotide amidase
MFFNSSLQNQAKKILQNLEEKNLKLVAAESCTGGLLSALFTEIPGSSKAFDRGFVTYSNAAKIEMLGVKKQTLEKFGAVSKEVAQEMSNGAIKNSQAQISIAITGIAGPEGGSAEKPLGLVYIAVNDLVRKFNFSGDRSEVRKSSIIAALQMLETATQTRW